MTFASAAFAIAFGAAIGSFLKLCADRWPAGESVLWPRSHCDNCKTTLHPVDLLPILSYLIYRGRCRYCRAVMGASTIAVEVITALVFLLIWQREGTWFEAAIYAFHASVFILVAAIDFKHHLILNKITYPWALIALGANAFLPGTGLWHAVLGGATGLATFAAIYALSSAGMGFGDVKLAGVVGAIVGLPLVLQALALAAISGGIVGVTLLLLGRKGRKDPLPFGVFLALGGLVTMLWGEPIWEVYLALAQGR